MVDWRYEKKKKTFALSENLPLRKAMALYVVHMLIANDWSSVKAARAMEVNEKTVRSWRKQIGCTQKVVASIEPNLRAAYVQNLRGGIRNDTYGLARGANLRPSLD